MIYLLSHNKELSEMNLRRTVFLITLPVILGSLFHIIFFPELYFDSLIVNYWARVIFQQKTLEIIDAGPSITLGFASNYPPLSPLLSAFLFSLFGENSFLIKLVPFLSFLSLISLTYIWANKTFSKNFLIVISVSILVTIPLIIFFSRTSSHYLMLTLFFSAAIYSLQRFLNKGGSKYLFLASLFSSLSALTSYLGLLSVLFVFPWIYKDKRSVLVFMFLFLILGSSWYLRNLVLLGNPVWPFGGGRMVDERIYANSMGILKDNAREFGFSYRSPEELSLSIKRLFLYLPDSNDSNTASLRPIFSVFSVPGILLWLKRREKEMKIFAVWFLFVMLFYVLFLNNFEKYTILATIPAVFFATYLFKQAWTYKRLRIILLSILALIYLYSAFLSVVWDNCETGSQIQTEIYLQNLGNPRSMMETCYGDQARIWFWINENTTRNDLIGTNINNIYYFNRTVLMFDGWKLRNLDSLSSYEEKYNLFRQNGVTYLAVRDGNGEFEKYPEFFKSEISFGNLVIYRIRV